MQESASIRSDILEALMKDKAKKKLAAEMRLNPISKFDPYSQATLDEVGWRNNAKAGIDVIQQEKDSKVEDGWYGAIMSGYEGLK